MALLGTLQVRMGLDTAPFGAKLNGFTKDLEKRANRFAKKGSPASRTSAA